MWLIMARNIIVGLYLNMLPGRFFSEVGSC